jgi:hypothetical protein
MASAAEAAKPCLLTVRLKSCPDEGTQKGSWLKTEASAE